MKYKIACLQLTSSNHLDENIRTVWTMVEEAVKGGPSLIATPENTYFMRGSDSDAIPEHTMDNHPGLQSASALAKRHGVPILIGSVMVAASGGKHFNRSVLINASGEIAAFYDKIHLFDAEVGDGPAYQESARVEGGATARIAELGDRKIGMTVCYDLRFPYLFRDLAHRGAEIIAVPAAFTVPTGEAHWHVLLRARAIENGCFIIAPAQCGTHSGGRKTYGHTLIIGPWGNIIAEGGNEPGIITAEIDPDEIKAVRGKLPSLKHTRNYD